MADKGNISEKPVTEIFREMGRSSRSGILRVQADRHIRIVVFEEGRPVFGISNVPGDQLDVLLVRSRKLTPDQAKSVKSQITKEAEFGPKVVELGLSDVATIDAAIYDQICRIVQNTMLMFEGEYTLDFSQRVNHDVTIDAPLDQWLLDTARNVSPETARRVLGDPNTLYVPTGAKVAEMSPLDGFLLSRISSPKTVDEIHTVSGLSEEQSIPTIYALFAAGLIAVDGAESAGNSGPLADAPIQSVEEIRDDLDRVLGSFVGAEYYDVLQITRRAEPAEVKRSYYALAKKFHPDRYQHTNDQEIRDKLEAIFSHVSKAYDTLKDEKLRADYDRRIGAGTATPSPIVPPKPIVQPLPSTPAGAGGTPARPATAQSTSPTAPEPPPVAAGGTAAQGQAPMTPRSRTTGTLGEQANPEKLAEQHYNEAMKRLDSRDLMGAIALLREAVRLAPSRGTYHYQLGAALATNPRWSKEAEKHLLEATRFEPTNAQIFLRLGQIYRDLGLQKRAESQFRHVLAIDPINRAAEAALVEMGVESPKKKGAKDDSSGNVFSKLFRRK